MEKHVVTPLAKSVSIPLGLTAALATEPAIQKKMFGSATTALILPNKEMGNIMKIAKESLEE